MSIEDQEWKPPSEADMKLLAARRERSDKISKLMSGYLLKGYKMLGSVCDKCDTILLQDRLGTNYCVACSELDSDTDKDDPLFNQSAAMSMAKELQLAAAAASVSPTESNPAAPSSIRHEATSATSPFSFSSAVPEPSLSSVKTPNRNDKKTKILTEEMNPNLSISSIDVQSFTTNQINTNRDKASFSNSKNLNDVSVDSGFLSAREIKSFNGGGDVLDSLPESVHISRLQTKINWASQELQSTHSVEYSIHLCQLMKIAAESIVALRNARM